jgi:hypothetical protein
MLPARRRSRSERSARETRCAGRGETRCADVTGQSRGRQIREPAGLVGLLRRNRDREPGAAFGAPPFQDIASARRRHPGQKPVRAQASPIVGLKSPFHLSRSTSTSLILVQFFSAALSPRPQLPTGNLTAATTLGAKPGAPSRDHLNAPSNHTGSFVATRPGCQRRADRVDRPHPAPGPALSAVC